MRDLSKNFYEKMNNVFDETLHENSQKLFIVKEGDDNPISLDYSRVFFNCNFEIFKKHKEEKTILKAEAQQFDIVDSEGKNPVTFHLYKNGQKASLTKEQYDKILIDCSGNIYKLHPTTCKAVPADPNSVYEVVIL